MDKTVAVDFSRYPRLMKVEAAAFTGAGFMCSIDQKMVGFVYESTGDTLKRIGDCGSPLWLDSDSCVCEPIEDFFLPVPVSMDRCMRPEGGLQLSVPVIPLRFVKDKYDLHNIRNPVARLPCRTQKKTDHVTQKIPYVVVSFVPTRSTGKAIVQVVYDKEKLSKLSVAPDNIAYFRQG